MDIQIHTLEEIYKESIPEIKDFDIKTYLEKKLILEMDSLSLFEFSVRFMESYNIRIPDEKLDLVKHPYLFIKWAIAH